MRYDHEFGAEVTREPGALASGAKVSGLFDAQLPGSDAPATGPGPGGPLAVPEPTDVIPGDSTTTYTLAIGGSETGVINTVGDDDWFRVDLVAGQSYVFTMTGAMDAYLELRSPNGLLVAIDDDGSPVIGSLDSQLRYTAQTSGAFYLNARAYEGSGVSNTGAYTVTANLGPPQNPLDTIDLGYTAPNHIDVYFATSGQTFQGDHAVRSWTQAEINAAMAALATYSAVTPLTFSRTTSSSSAEFVLTLANLDAGELGHFQTVNGIGYGAFTPNDSSWTAAGLSPGGAAFTTLIHEFGHGLGLAHPHDNGGVSEVMEGVTSPFNSFGTWGLDQQVFTVMSYNRGWPTGGAFAAGTDSAGNAATPGPLDIGLLQEKYGGIAHNAGDTIYTLGASAAYQAIWDTGGVDSIVYAGSGHISIDLRDATLLNADGGGGHVSSVFGSFGGFTIAHGVVIENATGGSGNDSLFGNAADNVLNGGEGLDALYGGPGADTLIGGGGQYDIAGYSTATSGVVADLALGGSAGDAAGDVYVNILNLLGSSFDDVLRGDGNNNEISGGDGNDVLDGRGGGFDQLHGGNGDDTYILDEFAVVDESGSKGLDTVLVAFSGYHLTSKVEIGIVEGNAGLALYGSMDDNTLYGGVGDDTLSGWVGNDALVGGNGNDLLDGEVGADTLSGGVGNDTYVVDDVADVIFENPGEGADLVQSSISWNLGANFENLALTGSGTSTAVGNELDNDLTGNDAANTLYGRAGADMVDGAGGADTVYGDDGNDTLVGGDGVDLLDGGNDNDHLSGGTEADALYGRAGLDTLDGGAGADTMYGGAGDDTYLVDNASDVTLESSGAGNDTVLASITYALNAYIENLTLSGSDALNGTGNILANILVGNDAANTLSGGAGFDTLNGNGGADILNGGNGNDTLSGGDGNDQLDGGNDLDVLSGGDGADTLFGRSASDTLNGDAGADTLYGGDGDDAMNGGDDNDLLDGLNHNDTLSGGNGDDTLYGRQNDDALNGDAGQDTLYGGDGNDTLNGGSEADTLDGGNGIDALDAGAGADALFGRQGNDTLNGGADADTLTGGDGDDTFAFQAGEANGDAVVDFHGNGAAPGDTLTFSGYGLAGDGASFIQVDATHWQISSADDAVHEIITFTNGASIDPSDWTFI